MRKQQKRSNRGDHHADRKAAFDGNAVIDLNHFREDKPSKYKRVEILPRNLRQEDYLAYLDNPKKDIVFALGPAGTGKTLIATLWAIKQLKARQIERIVITRPAVSVDEQHGFLPGTLEQKMAPWTRPIMDVFREFWDVKQIEAMLENEVIEIAPLAYMRGRTFKNCVIIGDELQNSTVSQMKMLLTRIGEGSKMIVTGDLNQHDRGFEVNGLGDFIERLTADPSSRMALVEFDRVHVERHPAVTEVLRIYGDQD
jgi:phosphate starvation-inducible protein PhoH and related proteins